MGKKIGYIPFTGTGTNGVLIILEAGGADEEVAGIPVVGKAGHFLFQRLKQVDIEREGFAIHNCLSCRPPNNELRGAPYEAEAIAHCAPNLDATIATVKPKVILALGVIAFRRIMGLDYRDPILRQDYDCYPFWSDKYGCWVISAPHPSHIMQGQHQKTPILQFAAQRALEIARDGLTIEKCDYLLDPTPEQFQQWVQDYLEWLSEHPDTVLSYDIETPYKRNKSEADLSKEEDEDWTILRSSFCYRPGLTTSVPWRAEYLGAFESLFGSLGAKLGWNSRIYDYPRVSAKVPIKGMQIDGMVAWHILNSTLEKGLGFVTPFYVKNTLLWKHLSDSDPAFYNAKDADMALRNFLGIRADLIKVGLWPVFQNHIIRLDEALDYMSKIGVQRDEVLRKEAEEKVGLLLAVCEQNIESCVPEKIKPVSPKNGYKKTPKDQSGLVQRSFTTPVRGCGRCGELDVKASHFKARKKGNPCEGASSFEEVLTEVRWAKQLEFKLSKKSLTEYQKALKHQAVVDRRTKNVTFDEEAIMRLVKKYPNDPLYKLILDQRGMQKLLSTYIGVTDENGLVRGGMPVGRDGRIHCVFSHNPSTLRLASQDPNMQNLPRPKGAEDLATIIRNLIVAGPGNRLLARDYSGIEAVLVGYFACAPRYIRLAKIDVHSFYTAYCLNALDGRVKTADLPDISWPDEKLIPHLAAIKKEFKFDRNQLYKHLVHGGNFMQTPKGAQHKIFVETGIEYPLKDIAKVMGVYFELFPEIPRWHSAMLEQANKDGFLRNPFGYIHRFQDVFSWTKEYGQWVKKLGTSANQVIAFLPQSTAAGIIVEAILRLFFERFEEAGQYLRLQVHDELLLETPLDQTDQIEVVLKTEMEKPVKALPLPASYNMGPYLIIDTEGKRGDRWGSLQ